jgi:hypothetical protein
MKPCSVVVGHQSFTGPYPEPDASNPHHPNLLLRLGRRGEVFTGFWLGGPKVRDHWEDLDVGGRITLRWTLGR